MALSAQERRQWRELERQLVAEDPRSAQATKDREIDRHTASTASMTNSVGLAGSMLALVGVLLAFMVVILAVIVKILLIGVLGFVLMIFGGTRFRPRGRTHQRVKEPARTQRDVL